MEAESVYCYFDMNHWTSLSPTRVAGMNDGNFVQIFYEDIVRVVWDLPSDSIQVNGIEFWVPSELKPKIAELINLVLERIKTLKVHE